MISGEKGPSSTAGYHFPLPHTQRRQPTGAGLLSLAANSPPVEQNDKRGETLISPSLSSPCHTVTLGGQFSWRKERIFLSCLHSGTEGAPEISS